MKFEYDKKNKNNRFFIRYTDLTHTVTNHAFVLFLVMKTGGDRELSCVVPQERAKEGNSFVRT